MDRTFEIRFGAVAGWLGLGGITLAFIVIPALIAGQPPTVNTSPAAVVAYFRHPEFAALNGVVGVFVGILTVVPFAFALRSVLRGANDRARTFADVGLALVLVSAPVYVVSSALAAMLVQAATGDATMFATLFRLYDVLYDGGADVLEGAWIGAFSLAAILGGGLPRWIGWLGVAVALSRWVKAFVPVAPVPEIVIAISGVLFLGWFVAIVAALTRAAFRPVGQPVLQTAS
jgi:hypothetical protein